VIITVTPAPAIDWTVAATRLNMGEVNRGESLFREASGKGLNVSWALHRQGVPTCPVFPAGGPGGEFMIQSLTAAGLDHRVVSVMEDVRTNMTLRLEGESETKINTSASPLSAAEIDSLMAAVREALPGASALVSCGSLPSGAPDSVHRDIVALGKEAGVMTVVDSSGAALADAVLAGPDLIKPNVEELEALTGLPMDTLGDVHAAATGLLLKGVGAVLVSLGRYGALLVDASGTLHGRAEGVVVVNTVGAGDALLAGFLAHPGDRVTNLTRALVWASSAAQSESTLFEVDPALEARVTVSETFDPTLFVGSLSTPTRV
jgi:1-phosphofructokinase